MAKSATTTHYAVLGLLAAKPWSTYELVRYMQDSHIRHFWSKTRARLYQTPKELVGFGWAKSSKEPISSKEDAAGRMRTIYKITPKGRRALKAWLASPSQAPSLEIESLVKITYAEQGSLEALREQIAQMQWALVESDRTQVVERASDTPQLPDRIHMSSYVADLVERIGWVVWEWLDELEQDTRTWETTEATKARVEEGKARYKKVADRMTNRT